MTDPCEYIFSGGQWKLNHVNDVCDDGETCPADADTDSSYPDGVEGQLLYRDCMAAMLKGGGGRSCG